MSTPKKGISWWLLVLPKNATSFTSGTFITNHLLPIGDISDDKPSFFGDFPIAGLDYTPFVFVRNGNTFINVTIPFVVIDSEIGNAQDLYAVEASRTVQVPISQTTESQWNTNPTCIYSGWGTHRPPLPVVVEAAKFTHKRDFTNKMGFSQWTEVAFTFRYIENHPLFRAWQKLRQVGGLSAVGSSLSKPMPF